MSNLQEFQQFGIGGEGINPANLKDGAVIYTRVSTKDQADNNCSLETQQVGCSKYVRQMGFHVVEQFGGTYESAKSLERKEFQRMMTYLRKAQR